MQVTCKRSPFLHEAGAAIRARPYSIRTEQTYLDWIRRFIRFHGEHHACDMGEPEVAAFLNHLVVQRPVAPAAQGYLRPKSSGKTAKLGNVARTFRSDVTSGTCSS